MYDIVTHAKTTLSYTYEGKNEEDIWNCMFTRMCKSIHMFCTSMHVHKTHMHTGLWLMNWKPMINATVRVSDDDMEMALECEQEYGGGITVTMMMSILCIYTRTQGTLRKLKLYM